MSFVASLEPTALWRHFDRILEIPRGSGNEQGMRDYVLEVARGRGLEHQVDGAGNVVVRKPAAPGRDGAAVTVLQSHLDMVNEKNAGTAHDFERDPIRPRRDGDYLAAEGTTLGSDNGIGVAAMLALVEDDDIAHPPLELLFTVDEETGLTGAMQLDASMLRGRRLINLAVIALAQHLVVHFSEHDLARLSRKATRRSVGDMKFGDRRACDQMVERIRQRINDLNADKQLADRVKRRADRLVNEVEYRHESDAMPKREGLAEIPVAVANNAADQLAGPPLRVNVLEDDFWDLSQVVF